MTSRTQHHLGLPEFDSTAASSINFGDSAQAGTVDYPARRDHKHAMAAASAGTVTVQDEGGSGTGATVFNFVGSGVSASVAGGTATVTVAGGGGAGALTPIGTVTVGAGGTASVSFTSLGSYAHLWLTVLGRCSAAVANVNVLAQFNGDTAANYDFQQMYANTTTLTGVNTIGGTGAWVGWVTGTTANSGLAGYCHAYIWHYAGTAWEKNVQASGHFKVNTSSGNTYHGDASSTWRSAAAIGTVVVRPASGTFDQNTVITLYGIS